MTATPQLKPEQDIEPPIEVGDWVVTAEGLESRVQAGPDRHVVEYVIERDRLLRQRAGSPGVCDWTLQLAEKSWIDSAAANTGMIEAVETAIRHHHPDQQAIDFDATRVAAEERWMRTHRQAVG
jgi:hypothetical protein